LNGQKGVAIIVIAMVLTGSIGLFANMNEDWTTKTVYDKVTDLEGIIGQNAGTVDSYDSFYPLRNVTGWEGKYAVIPKMGLDQDGNQLVSPYVINPVRSSYVWDAPVEFNMRSLTHTVGGAIYGSEDTLPYSDCGWATNKSGVTYQMYPIDGDETTNGRDSWIRYSDGTIVHGGETAKDVFQHLSLMPTYLKSQTDYINYYVAGELQSKYVIFDTISDLMSKLGKSLQNNQLISIEGGTILYESDLHATKTSEHAEDRFNNLLAVYSNIYLDGTKSTVNTVKYNNGMYSGVTSLGSVEWESQAVYIVATQPKITITIGTPLNSDPQYADPYELVTLVDSEYELDEHAYAFSYDYSNLIQTNGSARTDIVYTWNFKNELHTVDYQPVPNGNGETYAVLSNGESMYWPTDLQWELDADTNLYDTFYTRGLRGVLLNTDLVYEDTKSFDVDAKIIGDDKLSSGGFYFIYTDDLLSKYIPAPQIGDTVTFTSAFHGTLGIKVALSSDTYPSRINADVIRNWIGSRNILQYQFTVGPRLDDTKSVYLDNVIATYTVDGWVLSNTSTGEVYPRLPYYQDDRFYKERAGNLLVYYNTLSEYTPDVTITYHPATIVYKTTDPDVFLADLTETPLALTDGTLWHGGLSAISNGTYKSLYYIMPDASGTDIAYDYLRWANLEDILRADPGIQSIGNLVKIQLGLVDSSTNKLVLTTDVSQSISESTDAYSVNMDSYRNRITCDYLQVDINTQGIAVWKAYSGTDVIWTGQLNELYLVQAQIGRDNVPPIVPFDVVLKGYSWNATPGDDEKVVWWSNSVINATVVNGSASFLIMPQSSVDTELQIFTGDTFRLDAYPRGTNYQLTYTINDNEPVVIGEYLGLHVTYSVLENTISIQGVMAYENTKTYLLSPVTVTVPMEFTDSLAFVYFLAFYGNWGAYVTATVISNDPMGYLWGGFNVNLDNYLNQYFPGLRVTIGGVVRYGDSFTVNNIVFPVADGKFTYEDTQYELRGVAIDYMEDNSVILHVGNSATLNLGTAQNHTISGEGSWYFSSGAFEINETKVKEYHWSPGWDLSFAEMMVLFMIILIGMAVIFMRVEWIGGLDRYDIIVLGIVTIISFLLIGGTR